jgi:hypothetical protein
MTEDSRPVPDPTALTTVQLLRELGSLRDLLTARLDAKQEAFELRIANVEAVMEERIASVFRMFDERDVRTAQASAAADQALNAALQAAKELVTAQGEASAAAAVKTETSFTKQIDQIGTIIQTQAIAFGDRLTEIKERIDRGEGQGAGRSEFRTERRLDMGSLLQALATAVAVISLVAVLIIK